ncbi:MAG: hypothetical protein AAGH41_05065 [Pseudomonadota bacterium]
MAEWSAEEEAGQARRAGLFGPAHQAGEANDRVRNKERAEETLDDGQEGEDEAGPIGRDWPEGRPYMSTVASRL